MPAARLTQWINKCPPTRLRSAQRKALHKAAQLPPIDYRDNLHRATQGGSILGSDSISMTAASDSSDKADAEHIQIGASLHLALGGLQIVDLASVRRHLACIGH